MSEGKKKIHIGFITYGKSTAKYLPYFLPSLKAQGYGSLEIMAVDNSEAGEDENEKFICEKYPEIKFSRAEKNLGFAKAYNRMINEAMQKGAEYFIAVNPDMIFQPDFISRLVEAIEADKDAGAAAPKILKWDFKNNKETNLIDSYGLYITKEHRFSDSRQGEIDEQGTGQAKEVFGFNGAAVIFRLEALRDTAFDNGRYLEFFDELMFMYKEDCDLSYRLRLAGWKIIFDPKAVAYHDRTASPKGESNLMIAKNRKNKSPQVKKWSFLNQWIIILKYSRLPFSFSIRLATAIYQAKSLAFAAIFEPYLLKEFITLWKIWNKVSKRREQLKLRISVGKIEMLME